LALLALHHGNANLQQYAIGQRRLSGVLPAPSDCADWIQAFIAHPPQYLAARLYAFGGNILFYGPGAYTFPSAAVFGLNSLLSSTPTLPTAGGSTRTRLLLSEAAPATLHTHVQFGCELINRVCAYAANSFKFFVNGAPDFRAQVQFLAGLNLAFNDLQLLMASNSDYARASFALSLLDKLANMVFARTNGRVSDSAAFRALLSLKSARVVRATAWDVRRRFSPIVGSTVLRHAAAFAAMHKQVRSQSTSFKAEERRLAWLWSFRNLKHGTYLLRQQFDELFLESDGNFPSDLGSAVVGLVLALCWNPDSFFAAF
jgi:hypothetical protein